MYYTCQQITHRRGRAAKKNNNFSFAASFQPVSHSAFLTVYVTFELPKEALLQAVQRSCMQSRKRSRRQPGNKYPLVLLVTKAGRSSLGSKLRPNTLLQPTTLIVVMGLRKCITQKLLITLTLGLGRSGCQCSIIQIRIHS